MDVRRSAFDVRRGRALRRWATRAAWAGGVAFSALWVAIPLRPERFERYPAATVLADRHGGLLRVRLGPGETDCRPVPLAATGDWTAQALVAAEDRRFWRHPGVDPLAVLRATAQNLRCRRVVSGASTISTQVIRLTDPRPRTPWTKAVEAVRALKMERRLSKAEVLEQYLNRAPFGANAVGIEAASRRWFGKAAADLSLAEAALLAGLPQAPARYRPDRHLARARARQRYVLDRMRACGFVSAAQQRAALRQPLAVRNAPLPFEAPHFADWALGRVAGGAATRTTLDPAAQRAVEARVAARRGDLAAAGVDGCAAVVLEVRTGAVRAMVGSPGYADARRAGQVNAAVRPRSPGSALKPFLYALALDEGRVAPDTVVRDDPVRFPGYEPLNFDRSFLGPVTVRDALAQSLNVPAVRLLRDLGQPRAVEAVRGLGLATLARPAAEYGLAFAVGSGEVTLLDLANAYAALARGGVWRPCTIAPAAPAPAGRRFVSEEAAFLVADILGGEERARELAGHAAEARLPRAAWKTGTSTGHRDAWALLYNPEYVVGVWAGNPDGRGAAALVGRETAVPLAYEILRALYPDGRAPWFDPPPGVRRRAAPAVAGRTRAADWHIPGVSPPAGEGGAAAAVAAAAPAPVEIATPLDGEVFRRLEEAPGIRQELQLAARGEGRLWWFANGAPLGAADASRPLYWPLRPGRWEFACSDEAGRSARVRVRVE